MIRLITYFSLKIITAILFLIVTLVSIMCLLFLLRRLRKRSPDRNKKRQQLVQTNPNHSVLYTVPTNFEAPSSHADNIKVEPVHQDALYAVPQELVPSYVRENASVQKSGNIVLVKDLNFLEENAKSLKDEYGQQSPYNPNYVYG